MFSGKPVSIKSLVSSQPVKIAYFAGLKMTLWFVARAEMIPPYGIAHGKFQGEPTRAIACGVSSGNFSSSLA